MTGEVLKIPIQETLVRASQLLVQNRLHFIKWLSLPVLLLFLVHSFTQAEDPAALFTDIKQALFFLVETFLYVLLLILTYRVTLLEQDAVALSFVRLCEVAVGFFLPYLLLCLWPALIVSLSLFVDSPARVFPFMMLLGVFYLYAVIRIFPFFPAYATERAVSFRRAFELTKGSFWRLFVILFLAPSVLWFGYFSIGTLGWEPLRPVAMFVHYLITIYTTVVASLAYQHLEED